MCTDFKDSGKGLVMLKERITSPLQYLFLRKVTFTMCFLLNLSFLLRLIILTFLMIFYLIPNLFCKD
jgi:hypothetical protein